MNKKGFDIYLRSEHFRNKMRRLVHERERKVDPTENEVPLSMELYEKEFKWQMNLYIEYCRLAKKYGKYNAYSMLIDDVTEIHTMACRGRSNHLPLSDLMSICETVKSIYDLWEDEHGEAEQNVCC